MIRRFACTVPTDVMEPTIRRGSEIVVDTRAYDSKKPQRWDVVVFFAPELENLREQLGTVRLPAQKCGAIANAACDIFEKDQWLVRPHIMYVKRLLGLPGERLQFRDGEVLRNGKPLRIPADMRKLYGRFETPTFTSARHGAKEVEIPKDHVFVLSDNHARGKDSREIGAVPAAHIVGRVVL